MVVRKLHRIDQYRIYTERNEQGRIIVTVYLDYTPIVRFDRDKINERKIAAVELVEIYQCSQTIAGKICGFHRNTVFKYVRIKRLLGIEALFEDDRGPKSPYKYVGKIRSHMKSLIRRHPEWTDQEVANQGSIDLGVAVSRSAVARIRSEKEDKLNDRDRLTRAELIDLSRAAGRVEEEQYRSEQLLLNFDWDAELKEKTQEFLKEAPPKAQKKSRQELIDTLAKGKRCEFAGNLMHHLFLEEIGFASLPSCYPMAPGATYHPRDIFLTLFHSIDLGIPSIEALKLVNAGELGLLAGLNRSPEKEVIRDHLKQMAEAYLSGSLIDEFARRLLEKNRIDPEVFFVDGHFLPYYGLHVIAKGYYTVRRLAMRGNEVYAVTDLQGRPLFSITESNEVDFRPILLRCAEKLVELGIERPVLVFDRGGYGIHFFTELDRHADFVTWAKYAGEQTLSQIAEKSFKAGILFKDHRFLVAEDIRRVSESVQTAKNDGRQHATSTELRLVVLKDVKTGRRLGIYTNNRVEPCWDIALYMLNRWGDSENFFKEMGSRFNLNYHPGYDIQILKNQPLVDNPDIGLIQKAIRILKKEMREIEREREVTELKLKNRADKRLVAKLERLNAEFGEKTADLKGFSEKLGTLPEKVSILDILKGKPMSRCDLEKKKLYDFIQYLAYHSRERLVEIFRTCYDDRRDVKQVLDMITRRGGYVRLMGKTLVVILDGIELKKHREAAGRLCDYLNGRHIRMAGNLEVKLFFCISRIPNRKYRTDAE